MKNLNFLIIQKTGLMTILSTLVILLLSCGTQPQRTIPSLAKEVAPRYNESEVLVQNTSSTSGLLNIYINGELAAQIEPNGSERIIVQNGSHSITVQKATKKISPAFIVFPVAAVGMITNKDSTETITFSVQSKRIVFKVSYTDIAGFEVFKLVKEGEFNLNTTRAAGGPALDNALSKAAERIITDLKAEVASRSTIAILSIYSGNQSESIYAIEKIEQIFFDARYFTIIERRYIDEIRKEKRLQESDEIDQATAAAYAREKGWNVVIIGEISGSGSSRRLVLRAVNAELGTIMSRAMEHL